MAQSGQICESCKSGGYTVYASMRSSDGNYQIQYLNCPCCGYRPSENKVVLPADSIRRRNTLLSKRLNLKRMGGR
jgi:hypothetical protein